MLKTLSKLFFGLFLLFTPFFVRSEKVSIGLFDAEQIHNCEIVVSEGEFMLYGNQLPVLVLKKNQNIGLKAKDGRIQVTSNQIELGTFQKVGIIRKTWSSSLEIKKRDFPLPERNYGGNFRITCFDGDQLKIINDIYLESYVGGVIEAESGPKQNLEYYKVQAIISRTYALSNLGRHWEEGFDLCDGVHCQVYAGKSGSNYNIIKATNLTKGIVVVDKNIQLINAAYHSNCGGHTANSEDVWTLPLPYLREVADTFCTKARHAKWEKMLPVENWTDYLDIHIGPSWKKDTAIFFAAHESLTKRSQYYGDHRGKIPMKKLRRDWKLKSTFFTVEQQGGAIHLKGKGYGHGVGMCQEGAMQMTQLGYKYYDVLHFYYRDVHLIDISLIDFFREE